MRLAVKFLPPWYPVEAPETEETLRNWITRYPPTTEALPDLSFTVIGVCRARDEMALLLQDGRIARAILPDTSLAPPSKDHPLEIALFDDVDELNKFIADDAAEHQ
ncbi:hypothetical protein [Bosea sp. (in: a-proteobacteria)]|uniref:hypothetical protein n=1 Tax=Bosea sp. (in: a-proteobacteria) TaxID=1871050 RepID=UPI002FCA6162